MLNERNQSYFDAIVLGAGAAGLMCAITAAQNGKRVLVVEVSNRPGKKILMSGGGRCNFTNLDVNASHFICSNPHFVKSALSQYTQWDFISMVANAGIAYHEKSLGQLFCDQSSKDILSMLMAEIERFNVSLLTRCRTNKVSYKQDSKRYCLSTDHGQFESSSLVIATGGLSIPTLGGATGFGYDLAKQFGLNVTHLRASLVPFTLSGKWHDLSNSISGVATPVCIQSVTSKDASRVEAPTFYESILFTHRGLSGPAVLQISNYWRLGEEVNIDLVPAIDLAQEFVLVKKQRPNSTISSLLIKYLPRSLVDALAGHYWHERFMQSDEKPLQLYKNEQLVSLANKLHNWRIRPSGTEGYRTAEVTLGGVDVSGISSQTMQVKHQPGLYFIGEALDVTGHLGGYNFQWAWSSGYVAGRHLS